VSEILNYNHLLILFVKLKSAIKKSRKKIKKNEMGGACGMNGRQERCIQGFSGET
jgi:hypothetical protein